MNANAQVLVERFEQGKLSRRQLVAQLMALGAASAGFAQMARGQEAAEPATQNAGTFAANSIDHLALSVTDVKQSVAFYERHLGLRMVRDGGEGSAFLSTSGTDFLALFRGDTPGLHHFSFGIPNYNVDDAARRIEAAGLKLTRSGNRVYFPDPDGLTLQVHAGRGLMNR
jgi:catechol 2,3-dioxygenase-like lactoylglutathione lyase family enzyme